MNHAMSIEATYSNRRLPAPWSISNMGGRIIAIMEIPACEFLVVNVVVHSKNALRGDKIEDVTIDCLYYVAEVEKWHELSSADIVNRLHRAVSRLKSEVLAEEATFDLLYRDNREEADIPVRPNNE